MRRIGTYTRAVAWDTTGPLWSLRNPTSRGTSIFCTFGATRGKQRCFCEANSGDCFLVKCHTSIRCMKDWIPLYLWGLMHHLLELITLSWGSSAIETHAHTHLLPVQERIFSHSCIRSALIKLCGDGDGWLVFPQKAHSVNYTS